MRYVQLSILGLIYVLILFIAVLSPDVVTAANVFFVSPNGSADGDGTSDSPWDLQTALDHPPVVRPGDTIYLLGGTYQGAYLSTLRGTAANPIQVKAFPGKTATIDWNHAYPLANPVSDSDVELRFSEAMVVRVGDVLRIDQENMRVLEIDGNTLRVERGSNGTAPAHHAAGAEARVMEAQRLFGDFTWYSNLVFTNSYTEDRIIAESGSNPPSRRRGEVRIRGTGNKLINSVIAETGAGIFSGTSAVDTEIYGNIIYHVGWAAPDRLHGHGLYLQNQDGVKLIRENIVFNGFSLGSQQYGSEQAYLDHFVWEGNVLFNDRFLWGGGAPVRDLTLRENFFHHTGSYQFGYSNPDNDDAILENNLFLGPVSFQLFKGVSATDNIWGNRNGGALVIDFNAPQNTIGDYQFENNTYYRNMVESPFATFRTRFPGEQYAYVAWDENDEPAYSYNNITWTGTYQYDSNGQFISEPLSGVWIYVRPNEHDPNRANVIVYNWDQDSMVTLPADQLSQILEPGDTYTLINAQDYFGDRITENYDGGDIYLDMVNRTAATPLGHPQLEPDTFPEFGVFVLIKSTDMAFLPIVAAGGEQLTTQAQTDYRECIFSAHK